MRLFLYMTAEAGNIGFQVENRGRFCCIPIQQGLAYWLRKFMEILDGEKTLCRG